MAGGNFDVHLRLRDDGSFDSGGSVLHIPEYSSGNAAVRRTFAMSPSLRAQDKTHSRSHTITDDANIKNDCISVALTVPPSDYSPSASRNTANNIALALAQ